MGEIVNLNRVRKAAARRAEDSRAAANRARHGRTAAERQAQAQQKAREDRLLDGAAIEPPGTE